MKRKYNHLSTKDVFRMRLLGSCKDVMGSIVFSSEPIQVLTWYLESDCFQIGFIKKELRSG